MSTSKSESLRERALAVARSTARDSPAAMPPPPGRPAGAPPTRHPAPIDDGVATLAMRYLIDGYPPDDVAQRLGINRTWCRRVIARLKEGK